MPPRSKADQEEKERREREKREFKEAQELESLRRAFKRIDKSGDGLISVKEVRDCRVAVYCARVLTLARGCACCAASRGDEVPGLHSQGG